ncbi:unnamed protein product [Polarella glacialis]|uniref:PDZ domain-containing protein n=1 Tax=Polarella glacialis TaxID=89957 RepID=A0A813LCT8_POLGL|nr:unnamed protein product [Polarella glacialis]
MSLQLDPGGGQSQDMPDDESNVHDLDDLATNDYVSAPLPIFEGGEHHSPEAVLSPSATEDPEDGAGAGAEQSRGEHGADVNHSPVASILEDPEDGAGAESECDSTARAVAASSSSNSARPLFQTLQGPSSKQMDLIEEDMEDRIELDLQDEDEDEDEEMKGVEMSRGPAMPSESSSSSTFPVRAAALGFGESSRSPSAMGAPVSPLGKSFQVSIQRISDYPLGLQVSQSGSSALLVGAVREQSLAGTWNTFNPEKAIRINDLILEVNQIRRNPQMMINELRTAPVFYITLQRRDELFQQQDLDVLSGAPSENVFEEPQDVNSWQPRSVVAKMRVAEAQERENRAKLVKHSMQTITQSPGPHAFHVWEAAAEWCLDQHYPTYLHKERGYLGVFGYGVLDEKTWSPNSQSPTLTFRLEQHIEQAGCTWYLVQCSLQIFEQPDLLQWEAPRRLTQMRTNLHDTIKLASDEQQYSELFGETPFARTTAPKGSTARLAAWLSSLAKAINRHRVHPAVAARTLAFFLAPLPRKPSEAPTVYGKSSPSTVAM